MLSFIPVLLVALFSAVFAHPSLQTRGLPGGSYTCTDPDFGGLCQWNSPSDHCSDDGAAPGAPNGVKSLGPDEGGTCTLFSEPGCKGKVLRTLRFPGMRNIPEDFASFSCKADGKKLMTR